MQSLMKHTKLSTQDDILWEKKTIFGLAWEQKQCTCVARDCTQARRLRCIVFVQLSRPHKFPAGSEESHGIWLPCQKTGGWHDVNRIMASRTAYLLCALCTLGGPIQPATVPESPFSRLEIKKTQVENRHAYVCAMQWGHCGPYAICISDGAFQEDSRFAKVCKTCRVNGKFSDYAMPSLLLQLFMQSRINSRALTMFRATGWPCWQGVKI